MPEIVLNGVTVRFPFEPRIGQKAYMLKVIECLQKGENGMLESTGKTLCLLCSTLGWLEVKKAEHRTHLQNIVGEDAPEFNNLCSQPTAEASQAWVNKNAPPKIIYLSRTHSQLTQAVNDLKLTTYSHLKVAVLGSRDQMCFHPEVSKETNNSTKIHTCQVRVKARDCYFNNQIDSKEEDPDVQQAVFDIEDLVGIGKEKELCPYYMARELKTDADIIFMPYNYLLDPKSRQAHGIELQGNIIIFDEAHNREKTFKEANSLQIRSWDLALCIEEIGMIRDRFWQERQRTGKGPSCGFGYEHLYTLKALFLELQKIQYLRPKSKSPYQQILGLQKFSDLIKILFSKDKISFEDMNFVNQCYKVHVKTKVKKKKKKSNGGRQYSGWGAARPNSNRVISYWCFNPGSGMKDLFDQGAKCILLTSQTLVPWGSSESELQLPQPKSKEQKINVVDLNSLGASASNVANYEAIKSGNKKIKLVSQSEKEVENLFNNNSGSTSSGEVNTAELSKKSSRGNYAFLEDYLDKVKKALGDEEFKTFTNAVKAYQKSNNYDAVVDVLVSLFAEDPSRHSFLKKFSIFVRKEKRPKFQQMCAEILGS